MSIENEYEREGAVPVQSGEAAGLGGIDGGAAAEDEVAEEVRLQVETEEAEEIAGPEEDAVEDPGDEDDDVGDSDDE